MSSTSGPSVVLLVEDDPNDVLFVRWAFGKAGFKAELSVVGNGQEAEDYLAGARAYADRARHPLPALLLLDLKVPLKNGLEILAWMRSRPELAAVRTVCLTSSREPKDIREAYALGASFYFVKPSALHDLLEQVKSLGRWLGLLGDPGPMPGELSVPAPDDARPV